MKALADYIHRRGLKAGLYTSPGPTTCGGYVGSYQHEAEDARRFAEWGFDFLKYDWCSYAGVAGGKDLAHLKKPYERMWGELQKLDRDIVLNLCQYGMGDVWTWGASCGNSWRTADDVGGSYNSLPTNILRDGFGLYANRQLHKFAGPGGWNDPDYLLLGYIMGPHGQARTPLTPNEQYAYVSLWSLVAAPLIFSGDITRLDDFTLGLLCNDEVIDVDQDPLGARPTAPRSKEHPRFGSASWRTARRRSGCSITARRRPPSRPIGRTSASTASRRFATSGGRKIWDSSRTAFPPPCRGTAWFLCG